MEESVAKIGATCVGLVTVVDLDKRVLLSNEEKPKVDDRAELGPVSEREGRESNRASKDLKAFPPLLFSALAAAASSDASRWL